MNNLNVQAIVAKVSSFNVQKKETWIFKILNLMVFINYKCIFMQKDTACHFYSVSNIYIYRFQSRLPLFYTVFLYNEILFDVLACDI